MALHWVVALLSGFAVVHHIIAVPSITKVDLQLQKNGYSHHTEPAMRKRGEDPVLVLRRGQSFEAQVTLDRAMATNQNLYIQLHTTGHHQGADNANRSVILNPIKRRQNPEHWLTNLEEVRAAEGGGSTLTLGIHVSGTAAVGKWNMKIIVASNSRNVTVEDFRNSSMKPIDFIILFNPWSEEDEVYMRDEELREEYVMNEDTMIWRGKYPHQEYAIPWFLGQFNQRIFDGAMRILDKIHNVAALRSDPVSAAEHLAETLLLLRAPTGEPGHAVVSAETLQRWTSSRNIMEYYLTTGTLPAGIRSWMLTVLHCTVLRSLGIPSRIITIFGSAEDRDESMSIDLVTPWVSGQESTANLNVPDTDSAWNYRIYNEIWSDRSDLGKNFSGWQRVDLSTNARTLSNTGITRPKLTPVKAVQAGLLSTEFNSLEPYGETAADCVSWLRLPNGTHMYQNQRSDMAGSQVLTKSPYNLGFLDITYHYKHPKGSYGYEAAKVRARLIAGPSKGLLLHPVADESSELRVEIKVPGYLVPVGEKEYIHVVVRNGMSIKTEVQLRIQILKSGQNRKVIQAVGPDLERNLSMEPFSAANTSLSLSEADYIDHLSKDGQFLVRAYAFVAEGEKGAYAEEEFQLDLGEVVIQAKTYATMGRSLHATLKYTNPLSVPLRNCSLLVDAPYLVFDDQMLISLSDVAANSVMTKTISVLPLKPGRLRIFAIFRSNVFRDVHGFLDMIVNE